MHEMPTHPLVSVLMSVHNGQTYLPAAIDSVLRQTLKEFEFIVIDDGSTDGSLALLDTYAKLDNRIRLVVQKKLGLSRALNRGLDLARGKYVARMDCDDVSLPHRLARQVAFMDAHPEVGICGSWVRIIGSAPDEVWVYPPDHESIICHHLFASALAHPSTLFRASILRAHNLRYNVSLSYTQDYAFWTACGQVTRLANVPEVLLEYRRPAGRPNLGDYRRKQQEIADGVRKQELHRLGLTVSPSDLALHRSIALGCYEPTPEYLVSCRSWLQRILFANRQSHTLPEEALASELSKHWYSVCRYASSLGISAWLIYNQNVAELKKRQNKVSSSWRLLGECIANALKSYLWPGSSSRHD